MENLFAAIQVSAFCSRAGMEWGLILMSHRHPVKTAAAAAELLEADQRSLRRELVSRKSLPLRLRVVIATAKIARKVSVRLSRVPPAWAPPLLVSEVRSRLFLPAQPPQVFF